ncbi:polysaccharide pyruvyl transferase family protein [Vreelandella stevensii]|uniref:polysaccharide pyruvyl transferase family protein n=1 Tax=Vreelandella stevensii TaxID=502821 RepID=UPI00403B0C00
MRACFFRTAHAIYQPETALPFQIGLCHTSQTSVDAHLSNFYLTGNKGNMVHRMAAIQSLSVNRNLSAQVHLPRLLNKVGATDFKALMQDNFDAVVLTMSNALRKGPSDGLLRPVLENLPDLPLYVLGLGMQTMLNGLDDLDDDMAAVVRLLQEKATFIGVRGHDTKRWLHENGITKAEAIGCPSMFVYPLNIAHIKPSVAPRKFMTSGYIGRNFLEHRDNRMGVLFDAFQGRECSYVFQMDLNKLESLKGRVGLYNEATNELDVEAMQMAIHEETGLSAPFTRYYSFNEVSAWRQAAAHHDVFIGDRIHGAVAAMQAGTPALVLYADARVRELTSYHGIPACSVAEFGKLGVDAAVEQYLNAETLQKFQARYQETLQKYRKVLKQNGLSLANGNEVSAALEYLKTVS